LEYEYLAKRNSEHFLSQAWGRRRVSTLRQHGLENRYAVGRPKITMETAYLLLLVNSRFCFKSPKIININNK